MADSELGGRMGVPGIAPLNLWFCQSAPITWTQNSWHSLVYRHHRINHPQNPPPLPPPPSLCRVHRLSEPFCTRVVFVLIWWRDVHFVINTFYDDFLYVRFINKIKLFLNHDPLIKNNRWKRWAMHYLWLLQTYLFQYSTVIVTASMYWNSVGALWCEMVSKEILVTYT